MTQNISPEELAAVVAAWDAAAAAEKPSREAEMPAWRRAMRDESVTPFDAPA